MKLFKKIKNENVSKNVLINIKFGLQQQDKDKIINYLKTVTEEWAIREMYEDMLTGELISGKTIFTDGSWRWSSALTYHVEKYNYPVSERFVKHMKKNNWQVPKKYRVLK